MGFLKKRGGGGTYTQNNIYLAAKEVVQRKFENFHKDGEEIHLHKQY